MLVGKVSWQDGNLSRACRAEDWPSVIGALWLFFLAFVSTPRMRTAMHAGEGQCDPLRAQVDKVTLAVARGVEQDLKALLLVTQRVAGEDG